jgi:hypothetical protein
VRHGLHKIPLECARLRGMDRRRLLRCLPALGAAAPAAALAFRLEPPTAEVAAAYGAGCPEGELHAALRAELDRLLQERALPPEAAPRLEGLARCPFCGCGVLGAADHGEAEPRPPG